MISSKELIKECDETVKLLERTVKSRSFFYSISIWLAVIIGIIVLGDLIENKLIKFVIGGLGLFLTFVPLILRNKIEKMEGYVSLSIEFKNLKQDLMQNECSKENLTKMKMLRKRLLKYPIIKFFKGVP